MLRAGVASMALPSAVTYARKWHRLASGIYVEQCIMLGPTENHTLSSFTWSLTVERQILENFGIPASYFDLHHRAGTAAEISCASGPSA